MRNTNNYALPQFDNSDLFTKEDFNDAFSKVDKALDDIQFSLNDVADGGAITIQEVAIARGYHDTLNDRLNDFDDKFIQSMDSTRLIINPLNPPEGYVKAYGNANYYNLNDSKWYVDEGYTQQSNDDYSALQALIDYLKTNGGGKILINASFYISNSLALDNMSNTILEGTGNSRLCIGGDLSYDAIVIKQDTEQYCKNIKICDFNIFFPRGSSSTTGNGIYFNMNKLDANSNLITLSHVKIDNMRIDNAKHAIYNPNGTLWFSCFQSIYGQGCWDSAFVMKGWDDVGRLATINITRLYMHVRNSSARCFDIQNAWDVSVNDCEGLGDLTNGGILGYFNNIRGCTITGLYSENLRLDKLPVGNNILTFIDSFDGSYRFNNEYNISNCSIHFASNSLTVTEEKTIIYNTAPINASGIILFGGSSNEYAYTLQDSVNIIKQELGDIRKTSIVNNLTYTWAGGGTIKSIVGSIKSSNITEKIPSANLIGSYNKYSTSCLKALLDTSTSIIADTNTLIPFSSVSFDNLSEFDVANNRFVPKVEGVFNINVGIGVSNTQTAGTRNAIMIYKNGVLLQFIADERVGTDNVAKMIKGCTIVKLNRGDNIQIYILLGSNNTIDNNSIKTYLDIFKIN